MLNYEEKKQMQNEAAKKMVAIMKSGANEEISEDEATSQLQGVITPLLNEYTKNCMELINPVNSMTVPVLVFAIRNVLAILEKQLDEGNKLIIGFCEKSFSSIAFNKNITE